jgi:hypothetical protein
LSAFGVMPINVTNSLHSQSQLLAKPNQKMRLRYQSSSLLRIKKSMLLTSPTLRQCCCVVVVTEKYTLSGLFMYLSMQKQRLCRSFQSTTGPAERAYGRRFSAPPTTTTTTKLNRATTTPRRANPRQRRRLGGNDLDTGDLRIVDAGDEANRHRSVFDHIGTANGFRKILTPRRFDNVVR